VKSTRRLRAILRSPELPCQIRRRFANRAVLSPRRLLAHRRRAEQCHHRCYHQGNQSARQLPGDQRQTPMRCRLSSGKGAQPGHLPCTWATRSRVSKLTGSLTTAGSFGVRADRGLKSYAAAPVTIRREWIAHPVNRPCVIPQWRLAVIGSAAVRPGGRTGLRGDLHIRNDGGSRWRMSKGERMRR
jgi:hypothetical protein